MRRASRFALSLGLAAAVLAGVAVALPAAQAAPPTNTVIEVNDANHLTPGMTHFPPRPLDASKTPGTFTFRTGPGRPPLGIGSLELSTPGPERTRKVTLFTDQFKDTMLSSVNELGYDAYHQGPAGEVANASLQLTIDPDGPGPGAVNPADPSQRNNEAILVYEPYLDTNSRQAMSDNVWQAWDVARGKVYSTKPIPGGTPTDPTSPCLLSSRGTECLNDFKNFQTRNPAATIISLDINQGSGNPDTISNVDAVYLNTKTFDFEQSSPPLITTAISPTLIGNANAARVSGTVTDGTASSVTVVLRDAASRAATATATVAAGSNVPYTVNFDTTTFNDGALTATATAVDATGAASTPAVASARKDVTRPALGSASGSPQPADRSVTISGSVSDASATGVTVSIVPNSGGVAPAAQSQSVAEGGGRYNLTFDVGGLVEGPFGFRVTAVDAAANEATPVTGVGTRKASGATSGPTPTSSSTTSPSATGSAGTAPPSPDATPTAQGCPASAGALVVRANTPTINATGLASATVVGARPGATVILQGYSQNHEGAATFDNDPSPADRVGTADSNGTVTFNDLRPSSNTRLRAAEAGCSFTPGGPTAVVEVRAQETLTVTRTAPRTYVFRGQSIPARPGGLIINLYEVLGQPCAPGVEPRSCPGEVFVGQGRANSVTGKYTIGPIKRASSQLEGRVIYVVKTGRDAQNAPGRSNSRSVLIF